MKLLAFASLLEAYKPPTTCANHLKLLHKKMAQLKDTVAFETAITVCHNFIWVEEFIISFIKSALDIMKGVVLKMFY